MKKTILLDTSFLLACAEYTLDYFSEFDRIMIEPYTIVTIPQVLIELTTIARKGDFKKKRAAKLAQTLLSAKQVAVTQTHHKNADTALYTIANKNTIVATIDAALKKKLRDKNVPVVFIRQKKYLALI